MRNRLEIPRLSMDERDRRWSRMREEMKRQDLDCLVLCGLPCEWDSKMADARYLSPVAGNAEFNFLVFPLMGEPTSFILMPTFLEYWAKAQDWVKDIRQKKGTWANTVLTRLKELGMEKKRIGVDGLAGSMDPDGWFPYSTYSEMVALLPGATFVNLDDTMERMRMVKSPEEIGMLEQAARLGDLMLEACLKTARPGVRECEVYGKMMETMISNGGEEPTLFLWAADAYPLPHPFRTADDAAVGEGGSDHLRDASQIRRILHPCGKDLLPGGTGKGVSRDLRGLPRGLCAGDGAFHPGGEDQRGDECGPGGGRPKTSGAL